MNIAVVIPSRNRPDGLAAALRALMATESSKHEVMYAVSYCRGDAATMVAAEDAGAYAIMRPDDCTPGAAYNHAAAQCGDVDLYSGFGDDIFPLTWGWDDYLARALCHPMVCFCWQEVTDPMNASYCAASARAVRAIGQPCTEYFPYWFTDLWLAEIHHMAFGFRPPLVEGLQLGGKRGTTQGFRDFEFWCRFFAHTRYERIRAAVRLAAEYGSTPRDLVGALAICRMFDADFLTKNERFSNRFADTSAPEPYYVKAKERAEAMLAQSLTAA
jgi:hypothetical protein